jgi:hypothetical protein
LLPSAAFALPSCTKPMTALTTDHGDNDAGIDRMARQGGSDCRRAASDRLGFRASLCGLTIAVFVGWRSAPADIRGAANLIHSAIGTVWLWLLRIGVPATIAAILMRSLDLL